VRVTQNSKINKVRLFSETKGTSIVIPVPKSKIIVLKNVELDEGENVFNWIGYDNNTVVYNSKEPFVIKKIISSIGKVEKPTDSSVGGNPKPSPQNDNKLLLANKPEVTNQSTYKLKLDASKMPPNTGKYVARVTSGDKSSEEKTTINIDKKTNLPAATQEITVKLFEGKNTVTVYPEVDGKVIKELTAQTEINCTNCVDDISGQSVNYRTIVGLEQVGASSANSKQNPFLSFYFNTPINIGRKSVDCSSNSAQCRDGKSIKEDYFFDFSIWGDVRFTTTPVQTFDALSNFAPLTFANSFLTAGGAGKVNDLVQSFDFLVGVEKQLARPGKLFRGVFPGRTSLSLIAAGGAISPLSSDKTATFYKVPTVNNGMDIDPRFLAQFPEAAGKKNVAFVSPNRDKFYRQYYGGVRLKTFFQDEDRSLNYFPAMFDITIGQNEAITSKLRGVILRFDGSTPLPIKKVDFLYIFGSAQMKLGKTVNQSLPSFFLEPATTTSLTSNDTVVIPIDRSPFLLSNRDVYRIGVGVDLFKLFEKKEQ